MSNLAAFYLKLDLDIPIYDQDPSRRYLKSLLGRLASEIYRQDVEVEIQFRQGSLEIFMVVAGSIYIAVGNYGSFRSGINQIIEDAKALRRLLVSSLRKDGVAESKILEDKRLMATPERVRRMLLRIDRFERQLPDFSEDEARAKLGRLLKSIQNLTNEMEFPEDINLLMSSLDERFRPPSESVYISYQNRKSLSMKKRPTFLNPEPGAYYPYGNQLPPPDDH